MIVNFLIPIILVLLMVIVGTGLQTIQFNAILRFPLPLLGGTLLQIVMLPLGALGIIYLLQPPVELAAGLLLVSACPGGALSNFYCHFGRLNVALSVMMTAVSSILGFIVLPIVLAIIFPVIVSVQVVEVPVKELVFRLFLLLLVPVGIGMLIRNRFPGVVGQYGQIMRIAGLVLVVLLLVLIFYTQWEGATRLFYDAATLSLVFTLFALSVGWVVAYLLRQSAVDRKVFSVEFAVRNVGAAAVVAATTLGRPEFVIFGALFVIFQFPVILLVLLSGRQVATEATEMS